MKKNQPTQMSEEQARRRQAQMLARQWQKQMKVVNTMYICPLCARKFRDAEQMKLH